MNANDLNPLYDARLADRTVLVVDDQKAMRQMLADLLRVCGFARVQVAADGEEAVEQIKTWLPDIVITDWKMERMNGLALVQWIRRAGDCPNPALPVVLLTGMNSTEHVTTARDAGVNDVLLKPVSPKALAAKVKATLFGERQFVEGVEYIGPCRRRRRGHAYRGPKRRLVDPVEETPADNAAYAAAMTRIADQSERMKAMASDLDPADRGRVRDLYDGARAVRAEAKQVDDDFIEAAAGSLVRYVEAVGASGALDREVVRLHVAAMLTLARLTARGGDVRRAIVADLDRMVVKKAALSAR